MYIYIYIFIIYIYIYILYIYIYIHRRVDTGGARKPWPPHFNFRIKQGPTVSVSNIRDIAFYSCSEIIRIRNFTIFTVYATISGKFTTAFYFFQLHKGNRSIHAGSYWKVLYLALDLVKSFWLWTIRKKITLNESLDVRL